MNSFSRVPINGMGSHSSSTEESLSQRTARFFEWFAEKPAGMELAVPSAEKLPEGIENPFVITTLVAGLIGVTISIILLISIWILASAVKQRQKANKGLKPMNMIHGLTAHKNGNEASSLENPSYVPPPLRQDDKVIIKIPKESSALSVNPTQDLLLKSVEEVDQ